MLVAEDVVFDPPPRMTFTADAGSFFSSITGADSGRFDFFVAAAAAAYFASSFSFASCSFYTRIFSSFSFISRSFFSFSSRSKRSVSSSLSIVQLPRLISYP